MLEKLLQGMSEGAQEEPAVRYSDRVDSLRTWRRQLAAARLRLVQGRELGRGGLVRLNTTQRPGHLGRTALDQKKQKVRRKNARKNSEEVWYARENARSYVRRCQKICQTAGRNARCKVRRYGRNNARKNVKTKMSEFMFRKKARNMSKDLSERMPE